MQTYHDTVQDAAGNIITTATVTVYDSLGSVANIYDADEVTALSNPFTVANTNYDTDGSFWFKAANGSYDIKSVSGGVTDWKRGIYLTDSSEFPVSLDNKAAAVLIQPVNNRMYFIGGADGGLFEGVTGAAPGTYSDNGGSYCGTQFIPTGGDGSAAWVRVDGGMIAHGSASLRLYRFSYAGPVTPSYRKIATLPIDTVAEGAKIKLRFHIDNNVAGNSSAFEIEISNRSSVVERVLSAQGKYFGAGTNVLNLGIRTYIESDTSISVYIYQSGTGSVYASASCELISTGYGTIATIIPPNSVNSITTPTGTLSLDTTAGKYANGVPDGNMDWVVPTLLNSWVNYDTAVYNGCGYMRDADGTVTLRGTIKNGTVGGTVFTLPVGYRPAKNIIAVVNMNDAFGRISVSSSGTVVLTVGTNTFASLECISFKAGA